VLLVVDNDYYVLYCMVRGGAREGNVIFILDGRKVSVILREDEG
jgi:hypothetical protein